MTTLRGFLSAEPFTLAMSSGFFGFFAHAGMLGALESEGLHPAAFSGSSAGALVSSLAASGHDARVMARELLALERRDFWDPAPGAGLLRGARFRARLAELLAPSFEACARPLAVSTFDVVARATRVLDRGALVPAVYASCAVPLLFHPLVHERRVLVDGGVLDRPGLAGVTPGARVLHHHLSSRSPWRRPGSPALRVAPREGAVVLVLDGLPRSGPFQLDRGREALTQAREATLRALDARPVGGVVRLGVGPR